MHHPAIVARRGASPKGLTAHRKRATDTAAVRRSQGYSIRSRARHALSVTSATHSTNPLRRLWALIQGDATFMRRVNGWLTIFWIAMIPVSLVTGWVQQVVYVSALSLWALVSGHWSAWQAARIEAHENAIEERAVREDIKQRPGVSRPAPIRRPRQLQARNRDLPSHRAR